MTDIAASHCRVCVADMNHVGKGAQHPDQTGFDRDLAMQQSLEHCSEHPLGHFLSQPLQHAPQPSSPNAFSNTLAGPGAGNNLMSVAEQGLAHADPALRNVFMQAVQHNRDRMAAELGPLDAEAGARHATAQPGLVHANSGLRDVFMQAVQNNRDRMAAEVALPAAPLTLEGGAHSVHDGLEALNDATRDTFRHAVDRHAEILPVRDMMRDGLLGIIDEIENPSPLVQMRRSETLGPDSRLDIDRVEAQMIDHLRDTIALFDRMQETPSDDTG